MCIRDRVYSDGRVIARVILPGGNDIPDNSYAIFPEDELSEKAGKQVIEYFNGTRKSFSVPVSIEGTEFEKKIYAILKEIPYGTTVSYSKLAVMAGRKGAARAVGQAVRLSLIHIYNIGITKERERYWEQSRLSLQNLASER